MGCKMTKEEIKIRCLDLARGMHDPQLILLAAKTYYEWVSEDVDNKRQDDTIKRVGRPPRQA